jgi:ribosomal protein S21
MYKKYDSRKSYSRSSKGGDKKSNDEVEDNSLSHNPIQAQHLEVKVFENFDRALRAFRALVQKERILSIYKDKQSYEKPSDKRRRKKNEMRRKSLEVEFKNDEPLDGRKKRKFKQNDENN